MTTTVTPPNSDLSVSGRALYIPMEIPNSVDILAEGMVTGYGEASETKIKMGDINV